MMIKPRSPNVRVTAMQPEDWPAVEEIYRQGIATGNATFETETPGWEKWNAGHHPHSRLVARDPRQVLGWAALSPVSIRLVYAGVSEVSIYVADTARSKGVGKALLTTLIEHSELNGIWTLQAGIFPENAASISLHRSCGFREVGRREKIGLLKGVWRDVVLLERRSVKAGK
ncbi:MAG: N-acetyltransferase family protein [Terriglobales bacterium]